MIPERTLIENLTADQLENLILLDRSGMLMGPYEDFEHYRQRLLLLIDKLDSIKRELEENGKFLLLDWLELKAADIIDAEIMTEAASITEKLYGFSINWVPGFFMSTSLGLLWGGCAISLPEEHCAFFLIRKNFRNAKKWFIYRRDELLAHELCHIARTPVNDLSFEEYFAYQTSFSRLRRYIGNCFIVAYDAILFIMPIMILLAVQIAITVGWISWPILPFWIIALLYPAWLLLRNQISRNIIH